jgi:hypothetical protein
MSLDGQRAEAFASDVTKLTELAAAVCLAPCVNRSPSPEIRDEARELQYVIEEIRDKLHDFLTDDVQADIIQLLDYLDRHRDEYRLAFLRWVDLLEDIAFAAEERWGHDAGPMKQREVRAAIYHILKGFLGPHGVTVVPPWMRPLLLEIVVRVTVEFLVTLDNPIAEGRPSLWAEAPREGTHRVRFVAKTTRMRFEKYRETLSERIVGWIVRTLMPPPRLSGPLRARVDAILEDWARRNRVTGTTPVERFAEPLRRGALWIGQHGHQVRAAVDAVALAVYETARLSNLDRAERIEVVKEAVVLMFADLGYGGPLLTPIVRMLVDLSAGATLQLFRKRAVV